MNIATGNSATKTHWRRSGAMTACNRKMSTNAEETESFKWTATRFPEYCCKKCLNAFVNAGLLK